MLGQKRHQLVTLATLYGSTIVGTGAKAIFTEIRSRGSPKACATCWQMVTSMVSNIKVAMSCHWTAFMDPVHTDAKSRSRLVKANASSIRQRRQYSPQTWRASKSVGSRTLVRSRYHVPCH